MSEQRIQKALTFLKNPKIASMTHEKKIEFLRTKLPPQEMEEVLRRYKEGDDFSQFFDQNSQNNVPAQQIPAQIPQQLPPAVLQSPSVPAASSKWSFGLLGVVASAIIGAIGSAMFLNAQPKDKVRRRRNQPRHADSVSNSSDLDSQRESATNELVSQRSQGENQLLERLITQQAEAFEGLSKQIASLQFAIETLKRDQAQLMTQPNSQPQNSQEISEPVPAIKFKTKEEINEIFQEFLGNTTSADQKATALKNMRMWFQNMVNSPSDQNKNKINTTNMQYKNSIAGNKAAAGLLEAVGLILKGNIWEFNPIYVEPLRNLLDLVSEEISKMPPLPPPKFNSSQPWLPQKQESAKLEENKAKEEQDKKGLEEKNDNEKKEAEKIEEIKKEDTNIISVEEIKESEQTDQVAIQNA